MESCKTNEDKQQTRFLLYKSNGDLEYLLISEGDTITSTGNGLCVMKVDGSCKYCNMITIEDNQIDIKGLCDDFLDRYEPKVMEDETMEHISNEEKANEISERRKDKHCVGYHCYRSAIEMADWKDEQIDTIMLTTEGCLRSFFESQGNTQESIDNFIDALKTQINENLNKL